MSAIFACSLYRLSACHTVMGALHFIGIFGEINDITNLTGRDLQQVDRLLYGAKIVVIDLACKKDINNSRESPAIKVVKKFVQISWLTPEFRGLVSIRGHYD